MKNLFYVFALALTLLFVACGDDESSSGVALESAGEISTNSSASSSDDDSSSSKGGKSSGSVSSSSKNSSSSAKSSPSSDSKSSSSSGLIPESCEEKDENRILTIYDTGERYVCNSGQYVKIESSSSSKIKKTCSADEEGTTRREDGMRFICEDGYWVPVESSSSSQVSSSSYFDMTNQFNEKVSYGEFTDPRDGQKYRTVSKYDDVFEKTYVFFAENLNYGKMVSGGTVQGDSTKYCYDNDPWYCENGWGGLYTWSNAMNFPAVCDSVSMSAEACSQKFVYPSGYTQPQYYVQHQGICPEGWHVASEGEWAYLQHSSVFDLGSKVAGFGNNSSGLSILPAGSWERYPNGSLVFRDIKKQAIFWTPQQSADDAERAHRVAIDSQGMSRIYEEVKAKRALSVRCVKDY